MGRMNVSELGVLGKQASLCSWLLFGFARGRKDSDRWVRWLGSLLEEEV